MGKRGPTPTGKLTIVAPARRDHPRPAVGMTRNARTVWHRIVKSYPYDHLKPQHFDQLRAYCESSAMFKKVVSEIQKSGQVIIQNNGIQKRNPWTLGRDAYAALMAQLSAKLGINKNSTAASRDDAGSAKKPRSKRDGLMVGDVSRYG